MSGVWVFDNKGVMRLVENHGEPSAGGGGGGGGGRRKVLIHTATQEMITSYAVLERLLLPLGWERYYEDPDQVQFHKASTVHISLPTDFSRFNSVHMYDIVVKNRNIF